MELLAELPILPEIRETSDRGAPITYALPEHSASLSFLELARQVAGLMPQA
jgi:hypothetical protein